MWFNILTHNHYDMETVESLSPVLNYLRNTLSLCGHEVTVVFDQVYPDAINLYLEHFPKGKEFVERFRILRKNHGIRIGIVATELMIGGAIPYGRHGISHPDPAYIPDRITGFHAVLKEVDFLWSLLPRTANEYRKRVKISEHFPVGYAAVQDTPETRRSPKDLPAVFFGKITPHRAKTLQAIIAAGTKVIAAGHGFPMGWQASTLVDSLLDRARIGLNLTLHAREDTPGKVDPRFVSCLRVVEMLSRDVLVVSEDIPHDNPYVDFMVNAPLADLPQLCRDLLAGDDWAERAKYNAAAFRKAMDVRVLAAPVIARTLAKLGYG